MCKVPSLLSSSLTVSQWTQNVHLRLALRQFLHDLPDLYSASTIDTDRQTYRRTDGRTNSQKERQADRQIDKRTNRRTARQTDRHLTLDYALHDLLTLSECLERSTDKYRRTDRQTDSWPTIVMPWPASNCLFNMCLWVNNWVDWIDSQTFSHTS